MKERRRFDPLAKKKKRRNVRPLTRAQKDARACMSEVATMNESLREHGRSTMVLIQLKGNLLEYVADDAMGKMVLGTSIASVRDYVKMVMNNAAHLSK